MRPRARSQVSSERVARQLAGPPGLVVVGEDVGGAHPRREVAAAQLQPGATTVAGEAGEGDDVLGPVGDPPESALLLFQGEDDSAARRFAGTLVAQDLLERTDGLRGV